MKLQIVKMHGCGNDFILVDNLKLNNRPSFTKNEILGLCDRHFGIGADGIVFLRQSEIGADVAWDFFNSDGSNAEMCGNAARCVMRFVSEKYFNVGKVLSLETQAGIIKGKMLPDGNAEVALFKMPDGGFQYQEKIVSSEKNVFQALCLNTGVPHAVIEVKDLSSYPISSVGRLLVKHPAFGPEGSNITFYQRLTSNKITSTTFERGVEEQTFACGTGATAAAVVFTEQYLQDFPIEVDVPGGDLVVDVSPISKMVLLRGEASYVFDGEIESPEPNFVRPELFGSKKGKG